LEPTDPGSPRPRRWQDAPPAQESSSIADSDEFVGFNLGQVGFIMRRAPFFAAVHRGPSTEPVSRISGSYLDSILRFNDLDVPLFRLDDLLRDMFRIPEPSRLRAGLVARIDAFGPACAEAFRLTVNDSLPGADTEYIAIGIGGNGAIRNMPWQELRPAPSSLRRFLWTRGIVACRFGEPGRIEYLIDPADIVLPVLAGKGASA
jgi:hypothetical protein